MDLMIIQSAQTLVYTAFNLNLCFYKITTPFYFQSIHSHIQNDQRKVFRNGLMNRLIDKASVAHL